MEQAVASGERVRRAAKSDRLTPPVLKEMLVAAQALDDALRAVLRHTARRPKRPDQQVKAEHRSARSRPHDDVQGQEGG